MSGSVSAGPAGRRRISAVYLLILYGLCLLFLTGCTGYDGKNDLEEGGIFYRVSSSGRKAFAQVIYWDLDPAHREFVIPDRVGKAQVVSLGGFYGTGVPCPLQVSPREGRSTMGTDTRRVSVLFSISVGERRCAEADERCDCFPKLAEPRTDPPRRSVPGSRCSVYAYRGRVCVLLP